MFCISSTFIPNFIPHFADHTYLLNIQKSLINTHKKSNKDLMEFSLLLKANGRGLNVLKQRLYFSEAKTKF